MATLANPPSSLLQKAVERHQTGDLEAAIGGYRRVLAERPREPDALHLLGVALAQSGRPAEAVPLIRSALEIHPERGLVHFNLGNALTALGRHGEALGAYQRASELTADRSEVHEAVCQTALEIGRYADALAAANRALALRPANGGTLLNKASALIALERFVEALECCDQALEYTPGYWGVHVRRGIVLGKLGRLHEAEIALTRAVELNPSGPSLHYDLGNLYGAQRRHELALGSFARALELKPDYLDARWNIALLRLLRGEFAQGWPLYEARFALDARQGNRMRFRERRWTGRESIRGQRILIWTERGLGDTLQLCRYAPLLRNLGADVTLEVHPRLRTLLREQFPGVRIVSPDEPAPEFDYQCPLLSVPGALSTELATIPASVPYLHVDEAAAERWARRLPSGAALRVGIVWQGNPAAERNWASGRSWSLAVLEPLTRLPGVILISLQTGPAASQLSAVTFADRIVSFGEELDTGPDAFLDTAAILESLDLVISCDTSVAHLAGALGVPIWLALHTTSEWRWLLERADSPWYPTMRLFRQRTAGDWSDVVDDLCQALQQGEAAKRRFDTTSVRQAKTLPIVAEAPRSGLAEAQCRRGDELYELGRYELALQEYERALSVQPDHLAARNNLGVTLLRLERFEDAERSLERALRLDPGHAAAHYNRGLALQKLGRRDDALQHYERAMRLQPDYAEAFHQHASLLMELGKLSLAVEGYDRAVSLRPRHAEHYIGRGNALRQLGRMEEALVSYDRALQIEPDNGQYHYRRGDVLRHLLRFDEAVQSYASAYRLCPEHPWLLGIWLHARMQLCAWDDLDEHVTELVSRIERGIRAAPPFSLLALVDSAALQRRAAETWLQAHHGYDSRLPALRGRPRTGRVRVGYFSADLHEHATAFLAVQLFERHDRERFELIALSFGPDRKDDMRARLRAAFDTFRDVSTHSDEEIAALSRELAIDIAVDLKGYTQQNRSGIFAHRAAPIQVSYLGYPGTSGAPYMDYLIADRALIPPQSRSAYSERIVYLPGSYQPNDRDRKIADVTPARAQLGLPDGAFVFCSFNGAYKLTPQTFAIWVRILEATPASVLWLLAAEETARSNLRREAAARGLDARRLIFAAPTPPAVHLARLQAADLFLDTLPCNAHTTASDALWAGLPVLTLAGESLAARVGASLLGAVGLPELITSSAEEYETLAVELARCPQRLAQLRQRLRLSRLRAPLFDIDSYTRHLEAAYAKMYHRLHAGMPPEDIYL